MSAEMLKIQKRILRIVTTSQYKTFNIIIVLNFVLISTFLIVENRNRYFGYILIGYVIVSFNILTDIR